MPAERFRKTSQLCRTLLVLLVLPVVELSPIVANAASLALADCIDFINEAPPRVSCGFVSVPRNHDKPDSRDKIELPVLIAKSTRSLSPNTEQAVLIPGGGGPGASMGFGYLYSRGEYLEPYQSLRQAGYDIVIIDQRGAGFASPRLSCTETIKVFKSLATQNRTLAQEIKEYHHAIAACRKRLNTLYGDLSPFDTRQSARDFLTIIDNLPYRRWSTIATSYATVLAQAMIIEQPDTFESVVLDSPVPLDYQQPITKEVTHKAIVKTINRCRQTPLCNSRYPALATQFNDILIRARTRPYGIKIQTYEPEGGSKYKTLIIDDNAVLAIFFTAIYNNESIAMLPQVINKLHKGHKQALKTFAEEFWYQSTDPDYADGLNMTIHCKERQILEDKYLVQHPDFLDTLSADSKRALAAQTELCKAWRVKTDNSLLPTKKFNTRTLVLAGSLDPVISKADISNTIDNFSDATTTVVQGAGHSVWFQSECAREQVVRFIDDSNAAATLNSCTHTLPAFK